MSLSKPLLPTPERPSLALLLFGQVYVATPIPDAGYALRAVEQGSEE